MPIKKVTIRIAAANAWKTGYWEKFDSGVQSEHPVPESAPKKLQNLHLAYSWSALGSTRINKLSIK